MTLHHSLAKRHDLERQNRQHTHWHYRRRPGRAGGCGRAGRGTPNHRVVRSAPRIGRPGGFVPQPRAPGSCRPLPACRHGMLHQFFQLLPTHQCGAVLSQRITAALLRPRPPAGRPGTSTLASRSLAPRPLPAEPAVPDVERPAGHRTGALASARERADEDQSSPSIGQWLNTAHQSLRAQQRFWSVVLVSALGESLDRASVTAARKVFVDGFMAHRAAYQVDIPTISLSELYDGHVADSLQTRGVRLHREAPARQLHVAPDGLTVELADGRKRAFDYLILATSWRRVESLLSDELRGATSCRRVVPVILLPNHGRSLVVRPAAHALDARHPRGLFRPMGLQSWPAAGPRRSTGKPLLPGRHQCLARPGFHTAPTSSIRSWRNCARYGPMRDRQVCCNRKSFRSGMRYSRTSRAWIESAPASQRCCPT